MKTTKNVFKNIPPIGARIIKSSIAVLLCYVVYLLRGKQGIVFYSQLAALWCMQPYVKNSLKNAMQRTVGTFIGAIYGLIIILIHIHLLPQNTVGELINYVLISATIIFVIHTTVIFNKKNASYFSCVVFLSITVNHIADSNPYFFVFNRVLDTLIGIAIGLMVNVFHLPRKKCQDILFISGLDDTLLSLNDSLSPYSRIELNQMIDDGAKFTISTTRTPASLLAPMEGINLNLPVIAMDGAVLYDIKDKAYVKTVCLNPTIVSELRALFESAKIHCFINSIVEDTLVIYYGEFTNEAEKKLYDKMHKSPYRNYIKDHYFQDENVLYFMALTKNNIAESFCSSLQNQKYYDKIRVAITLAKEYPGYSYIRIYDANATKQHMIDYLKQTLSIEKTVTFGSIPNTYDVTITDNDSNKVVKSMKNMYSPYIWKKS